MWRVAEIWRGASISAGAWCWGGVIMRSKYCCQHVKKGRYTSWKEAHWCLGAGKARFSGVEDTGWCWLGYAWYWDETIILVYSCCWTLIERNTKAQNLLKWTSKSLSAAIHLSGHSWEESIEPWIVDTSRDCPASSQRSQRAFGTVVQYTTLTITCILGRLSQLCNSVCTVFGKFRWEPARPLSWWCNCWSSVE